MVQLILQSFVDKKGHLLLCMSRNWKFKRSQVLTRTPGYSREIYQLRRLFYTITKCFIIFWSQKTNQFRRSCGLRISSGIPAASLPTLRRKPNRALCRSHYQQKPGLCQHIAQGWTGPKPLCRLQKYDETRKKDKNGQGMLLKQV